MEAWGPKTSNWELVAAVLGNVQIKSTWRMIGQSCCGGLRWWFLCLRDAAFFLREEGARLDLEVASVRALCVWLGKIQHEMWGEMAVNSGRAGGTTCGHGAGTCGARAQTQLLANPSLWLIPVCTWPGRAVPQVQLWRAPVGLRVACSRRRRGERERERLSTGAGQPPGLLPQEQSIARMKETKKETLSRGSWTMC